MKNNIKHRLKILFATSIDILIILISVIIIMLLGVLTLGIIPLFWRVITGNNMFIIYYSIKEYIDDKTNFIHDYSMIE